MVAGSCLCSAVRWELDGQPEAAWYCHCTACRRESGALFATWLELPEAAVRWTWGSERVRRYPSSSGFERAFCERCGAKVPRSPAPGRVRVPAGCLDFDPGVRPAEHRFLESVPPSVGAVARGGCLCGAFGFTLEGRDPPIKACHCSRCRKASGSAHDACVIASRSRVGTDRESGASRYELPEARFFAMSFCPTCGGPALTGEALAGAKEGLCIPAGCLEADPGMELRFHIFWGSRAPWFETDDGLPRFDEYPPPDFRLD